MNKLNKHFTASAVIIKDGKILLIWHNKLNVWLYPGGHIEENENPDDAVIREVKEETNLDVKIIQNPNQNLATNTVKVLHNPYTILEEQIGDVNENHYHIDMVYLCEPINENIKIRETEVKKYKWCTIDDIKEMEMFENLRKLLVDVLENDINNM